MPVSQSFPRHSPLPTNHPSPSTFPNSTTSYSLSSKSNVTLARSQSPKLRPSLDPSKPLHSALYQSPDNQANFESSRTCHTHMYLATASHLSTAPSTQTSFQLPGVPSLLFASSFGGCHWDHTLPYVMSRKHIAQYRLLHHNGLKWLFACMRMTPL